MKMKETSRGKDKKLYDNNNLKEGKSMFALNELYHKIGMDKTVVYFDTEMPELDFTLRLLSLITELPVKKIQTGGMTTLEEDRIEQALEFIEGSSFTYINSFDWNEDSIYTKLKILSNKKKIDLFIYDYIKNSHSGMYTAYENYSYLGQMTNFLKNDVAVGLDIPVLAFAQLNRNYQIADSDQISRYLSSQIEWRKKSSEEILRDGKECGTHRATVKLNRDGASMDDFDYIDFYLDPVTLEIYETKQQHNPNNNLPPEYR